MSDPGVGLSPSLATSGAQVSARFSKALGFAIAAYIAVVVARIHEAIPALSHIYVGKVVALLLIGIAFLQLDRGSTVAALQSTGSKCLVAITLLALLSVPGSFWPKESVTFFRDAWPQLLVLFFFVSIGFSDDRTARLGVIALVVSTALVAGSTLVGGGLSTGGRSYIGHALSSTYDPNTSAALFVMVLPYCMVLGTQRGKMRWIAMAIVPVILVAILKTGSRGGIIALAVLLFTMIIAASSRQRKSFLVVAALMIAVLTALPNADVIARFAELASGTDYNFTSRDGRWQLLRRGVGLMFSHPMFGVGVNAFDIASGTVSGSWKAAHNSLVQIGAELGLGGFVAYMVLCVFALRVSWRARRTELVGATGSTPTSFAGAAFASLVATLTSGLFLSMAYEAPTIFAFAVATAFALRPRRKADRQGAVSPTVGISGHEWRSRRAVRAISSVGTG